MITELNKEDSETYINIVKLGDMDKMFDFGYLIGRGEELKKQAKDLDDLRKKTNPTPK